MENEKQKALLDYIRDHHPDSLLANGYNDCIIGVGCGNDTGRVVYSIWKMLEVCAKELAVDHDEAYESLEYNTFGSYVGEPTPIYIDDRLDVSAEHVG